MLAFVIAWAQQQAQEGFTFAGDEFRTAMIGGLVAICSYIARTAAAALKELREVKIDMREVKRDIHGTDGKNGIKSDVRLLVKRVDLIEDRNIAEDAVKETERQMWPHPDRRHGPRRLHDVIREAQEERMRRITDEHSTHEE